MPSPDVQHPAEIATPHDLLLTGSALGVASGMMPDTSWARFGLNLARRPGVVAERVGSFGRELASIATGTSDRAPAKPDKRFSDPAWQSNPLMKRSMQAYLTAAELVDSLFADAELDWRDAERIRFVLDVVMEGLAPSNNPLISPLGWKAIIDTGGLNVVRGVRRFLRDMAVPPRIPSMVEPDAFTVGEDLAVTPGAVVYRNEVFELIQYTPQTEKVWTVPLLMVPPVINKFYILDIAPGRSMVEYLLSQGHQVFAISWRNPTAAQRSWGCDTYGGAIVDALDAIQKVTGSQSAHVQASCSGGILAAMTAAHLSAMGEAERIASLTLMVTVLDQGREGLAAAVDETTAKLAIAFSARKGYLDGRALAEVFAWLRPTDLVWRYWVNNYLQGRSPAPFDVLFWNSDTTRMPAALHRDMLSMGLQNALAEPGGGAHARHPSGPRHGHGGYLRRRRGCRPHFALAGLLSQREDAGKQRSAVHPVIERTHRRAGQSPWQPEGVLPRGKRRRTRPDALGGVGGNAQRFLVARLLGVVGAARRRAEAGAHGARR